MKFALFILPTIPASSREERARLRPIGRNRQRYQQMIDEVRRIAIKADEVGMDLFCTTEHHFHTEGYEVSVAPLLLYADLAARTKRIKFAPLSLVVPTWDPIRLAEETAVLDHLTGGRFCVGLARGYQDRWVNVLGQKYAVKGAPMDGSPDDQSNREVYEELVQVVRKAWMEESFTFKGKHYEVPAPYDGGITRWPPWEMTRDLGAPGEVDEHGVVRRISVVPPPLQDPHPPIFQSFSMSPKTIQYAAENQIVPFILKSYPPEFQQLCELYQKVAGESGRTLRLGEQVGCLRSVHFGATEAEAVELLRKTHYHAFYDYFGGFGFFDAWRLPGDEEKYPMNPFTPLPKSEWTLERMRAAKYSMAGTVDQVKRDIESLMTIHGKPGGNLEWFAWYFDQGLMSWDETQRQLETFAEHVIPAFRD